MADKKPRRFTVVEWLDPADHDNDGWMGEDEAKRLCKASIVSTYGEILEEDELFIKLAYNVEDSNRSTHSTGVITKATIVRRRDYAYPWKTAYKIPKPKEPTSERNTAQA